MDKKDFNYTAQGRVPIMGTEWLVTIWGDNNIALKKRIVKITQMKDAPVAQAAPVQQPLGVCPRCGAPMKLSKQGKPYCSETCWLNAGG